MTIFSRSLLIIIGLCALGGSAYAMENHASSSSKNRPTPAHEQEALYDSLWREVTKEKNDYATLSNDDWYENELYYKLKELMGKLGMRQKLLLLFDQTGCSGEGFTEQFYWSNTIVIALPKMSCHKFSDEQNYEMILAIAFHELGHCYLQPKRYTREIVLGALLIPCAIAAYALYKGRAPSSYADKGFAAITSLLLGFTLPLNVAVFLGETITPAHFVQEIYALKDIRFAASAVQIKEIEKLTKNTAEFYAFKRLREVNADNFALEWLVKGEHFDAIALYIIHEIKAIQGFNTVEYLVHPAPCVRTALYIKKLQEMSWPVEKLVEKLSAQTRKIFEQVFKEYQSEYGQLLK